MNLYIAKLLQTAAVGAFVAANVSVTPAAPPATLAVAGRANANPSIAVRGSDVAVAWSAATVSTTDVYAALSRDGGATFSAPLRVNSAPGDARASSEQPPRVALVPAKRVGAAPELVVVWTAKGASGTRLLSARSTDGARTFGRTTPVPGADAAGSRGWQSIAVDGSGRVLAMWLDHRATASSGGMMHHDSTAPKPDPTERAALSRLYFAALNGRAAQTITGGVCYCCKTSLVASGKDVYGVWRAVYAGSQRDIAFAMSRDGGRTFSAPVRVSDDGWHIDGCPENGPAIAVDAAHRIHVVWVTPPDGQSTTPLGLFYAVSTDGKRFSPRVQIPTNGVAGHAQIAIGKDGEPVVAWDESAAGVRRIAFARVRKAAGGAPSFVAVTSPDAEPDRGWPVLGASASGVLTAWVSGSGTSSTIRVARLP